MRRTRSTLLSLAALGTLALPMATRPLRAQSAEGEVIAVVNKLFDAMRTRDTVALRSVFDPQARLAGVSMRGGTPTVQLTPASDFIAAVGKATGDAWNERTWDHEVRIDGNVAQVWTKYDFHIGEKFCHCGIDAFQMVKLAEGWKILHLADTRQREGCTAPPAGK